MGYFIGIDLGTTNSSICSYDENDTRVWKSPDQNDVTPSVIFTDRRGNQYVGKRAYDSAPQSPENAAMLFKRYMGTNTPIKIEAIDKTVTPEECSAEVLKVLFGYLNEEIRNDSKCGSVITVPAAFNQMQKNATLEAAKLAGIGKVALMQEPVAAVMSVMRNRDSDGMFLVYDLGGGTLDIAIAESMGGRVSLISHGGIQMCGGRDIDKLIYGELVIPWLNDNFELPEVLNSQKKYAKLERLALWSIERAKIELSARLDTSINLSEEDTRLQDLSGNDIYLEIPLTRSTLDSLIDSLIDETIDAGKEIIKNAGLSASDIERIVFIGGPTNYKPLRDKVSSDLGIPGSAEINPMTAVAIGASLFAESVNWDSVKKDKKSTRGQIGTEGDFSIGLHYTSRTPQLKALLVVKLTGQLESGATFQIDSLDTGWTSGRIPLEQDAKLDLSLPKTGENKFKAFIFNSSGDPVSLENNSIIITRTTATVDAIPASHSIGIEVLDKLGGRPVLEWLVKSGDPLPKKGKMSFKAGELLKAGSTNSLNFKLWEGEIYEPISDNRPIGVMKITGNDFDEGVIPAGSSLDCEYEISDSGNIEIIVSVPSIGGTFDSKRNFYSRQEGQIDFSSASALVAEEGEKVSERIEEINDQITDPRLDKAMDKLEIAKDLQNDAADPEETQKAMENVHEAKKLLATVRKENQKKIRQLDLEKVVGVFDEYIREYARSSEETTFDSLAKTAQRAIERNDPDFENQLDELRGKNWDILWRQDWFVIDRFRTLENSPHLFSDGAKYDQLCQIGMEAIEVDDIDKLRQVIAQLHMIRISTSSDSDLLEVANIIRS